MHSSSKQICLTALVILMAGVVALPSTTKDVAFHSLGDVDAHSGWDGTTGLVKRSDTAAYMGNAALMLSAIVTGSCSLSSVQPGLVPICVASIAFAAIGVFINLLSAFVSANRRSFLLDDDAGGHFNFHYPSIEGGQHMFDQVQDAFHAADGLPVLIATTSCEDNETCHRVWYSKVEKTGASNEKRTFHHVHATPIDHDFRHNSNTKGTDSVRRRGNVQNADSSVTEESGDKLYGGYVFETVEEKTDEDIVNMGTKKFAQGVMDEMSSQFKNDNQKFNAEGIYCMDFDTTNQKAAGTTGYLWYYSDQSKYPSGEEESFMNTCSAEAS